MFVDGMKVMVKQTGLKVQHVKRCVEEHRHYVNELLSFRENKIVNFNIIKTKFELRFGYLKSLASLKKMMFKMREFFIPGLTHIIHENWLMKKRMLIERGNVINVGRIWWYGGALQFAQYMNYDIPGMEWSEGDYVEYDKHLLDWLITMYLATNMMYYDVEKMNESEKFAFFHAHSDAIFAAVVKITCHASYMSDELWSVIIGSLYSGGPITSPGGSWMNALMWCLFMIHVIDKHPKLGKKIIAALKVGLIHFACYGDDHLYCYPSIFSSILCEREFAKFMFEFFGTTIQEVKTHRDFLSIPSPLGGFIRVGPKFLKRYFISSNYVKSDRTLAEVLPYKPIEETVSRMFAPKTGKWVDAVLSSIGQAWDTMFTNPVAYDVCQMYFHELISDPPSLCKEFIKNNEFNAFLKFADEHSIKSFLAKACCTVSELFNGFPSMSEVNRHVPDQSRMDHSRSFYERENINLDDLVD